ncbi:hypothetical protein LA080_007922 [Diaporthe eres]|uniref:Heterokaryon incompatibility domain-containing protein n=1 Tax=Diaporthe vaccinii TaxID=105482 RepID=A0ABR4EU31_9PEZI|nr:hypothetical protein LA080_007922 [Diaporthe eres]
MQPRPWTAASSFYPYSPRRSIASYRYRPLPDASQDPRSESLIRLLEVKPADRGAKGSDRAGSDFRCSLRIFKLSQAPEFQALSYTWGDPLTPFSKARGLGSKEPLRLQHHASQDGSTSPSPHIEVDSHSLAVTPNLLSALRMLASRSSSAPSGGGLRKQAPPLFRGLSSKARYFWIDAICVDQSNVLERNSQVSIMADVFRAAQSVTVWLGPEDQFTADALAAVEAISPLMALTASNSSPEARRAWDNISYTDFFDDSWYSRISEATGLRGSITHRQWLGLLALLSRPWFQRAWVVQELALARQATVICGEQMVHWTRLAATLTFIHAKRWYHHLCTEKMRHIASLRDDPGVYSEFLASRTEFPTGTFSLMRTRKILRYNALGPLLPKLTASSDTLSLSDNPWGPRPGTVSLDTLMQVHRDKLATDPRDKVYAFVGLANTKTLTCGAPLTSVRPDYELPVQDVYTRLMAQLLLAHQGLHLLSHVQDPSLTKLEGLPSWVPDFSVQLAPYPLRFRGAVSWSACGNARWQPPSSDEDMKRGILRVQGSRIGVVEETALLQNEAECSAEYWASIVNLALGLEQKYPQLPNWTAVQAKPQSRLEVLWRTLITDLYSRRHPAPDHCGKLFMEYILNLQIRHTLAPWSDVDFMPHQSHTHADNIQPRWHDLLRSESEGLAVYKKRMSTIMESIFQGTYSPMNLAELQHDLDIASGSSRRLFRTDNGLLGTGMKSVAKGDEVWVLAGSKLPLLMRKRPSSERDNEFRLVGEAYVHGIMHWEGGGNDLPGMQDVVLT